MEIKDRLKEIRSNYNLTQQEFADRLGIKRNTIATYETGKSNPSDSAIVLICREFNVNEEWLRTGIGKKYKEFSGNIINQLAAEYSLSDIATAMIRCFIDLKPEVQNEMFNFFKKVVLLANGKPESETKDDHQLDETMQRALELFRKNFSNKYAQDEPTTEDMASRTIQEMSRKEIHAELDRQLDAEKEVAENAQGYGRGSSGTATG